MVGEILSCLEDNGLSDNTLVIFTSDNGGMFNQGGQAAFKLGIGKTATCLDSSSASGKAVTVCR